MRPPSKTQLTALRLIRDEKPEGYGEFYTCHWDDVCRFHLPGGLDFRNCDAVLDALVRRGLLRQGDTLEVTEAGHAALARAGVRP